MSKEWWLLAALLSTIVKNTHSYHVAMSPGSRLPLNARKLSRGGSFVSHKSSITLACKKTANKLPSKGFGAPPPPPVDRIKASSIASTVVSDIGARDDLTLHELASRFASVLQHYSTTQTLTEEVVQRNMLATRLDDLHLARCRCAPSLVSGAGNGLFASRDIALGELITLYPGDALLRWEDGVDHSPSRPVQVFFGKHVSPADQNAQRFVNELRAYEVPASASMSIIGDPNKQDDAAYLGHFANDAAMCSSENDRMRYQQDSEAGANSEIISVMGSHMASRALKHIKTGDEILVSYGYGYWITRSPQ
eukprot:CAMPEP_0179447386 /NCGR_PEP_ID=MMETSP0799-20121207/31245_1 /TAXON_ID=46947 /ORGANISM="Geminigera cryophila, Strain CCMP2564" /LENGTH=307 /DNA_ID=CAMNT_0021238203 /DNA_START=5 /DNA_END=928 /DNA_ORIENTATION=-